MGKPEFQWDTDEKTIAEGQVADSAVPQQWRNIIFSALVVTGDAFIFLTQWRFGSNYDLETRLELSGLSLLASAAIIWTIIYDSKASK